VQALPSRLLLPFNWPNLANPVRKGILLSRQSFNLHDLSFQHLLRQRYDCHAYRMS